MTILFFTVTEAKVENVDDFQQFVTAISNVFSAAFQGIINGAPAFQHTGLAGEEAAQPAAGGKPADRH